MATGAHEPVGAGVVVVGAEPPVPLVDVDPLLEIDPLPAGLTTGATYSALNGSRPIGAVTCRGSFVTGCGAAGTDERGWCTTWNVSSLLDEPPLFRRKKATIARTTTPTPAATTRSLRRL